MIRDLAAPGGTLERLPSLQELRSEHPEWLETRTIEFEAACRGEYAGHILAVSHRWDTLAHPDPSGEQLRSLAAFLRGHPEIELVFYDYSSLPQGKLQGHPGREYLLALPNINLLHLRPTTSPSQHFFTKKTSKETRDGMLSKLKNVFFL